MAFTNTQTHELKAKLESKHVKTRKANGDTLHYVEGWHVIAEANRIFGHEGWDRETITTSCVWSGAKGEYHSATYIAKVRVIVRAGDVEVVRKGSGTGEGRAFTPGQAHEFALKGAETDATKRALATFGNPFGLALYDREQAGVRKPRNGKATSDQLETGPWRLRGADASDASFDKPEDFGDALRNAMNNAKDVELLFAIWEQNVDTVRAINKSVIYRSKSKIGFAQSLVKHLKACAIALARAGSDSNGAVHSATTSPAPLLPARVKIDKSVLTISEPKRHRSKKHLRFVAQQPCLVCGRTPSQAHHIRFAQSRGIGLKVSDEFTVPLCAIHHTMNHAAGDEPRWWQDQKLDPLNEAAKLWRQSYPQSDGLQKGADLRCSEV
jgi:Rad52/22 family double-strand break repair protein